MPSGRRSLTGVTVEHHVGKASTHMAHNTDDTRERQTLDRPSKPIDSGFYALQRKLKIDAILAKARAEQDKES